MPGRRHHWPRLSILYVQNHIDVLSSISIVDDFCSKPDVIVRTNIVRTKLLCALGAEDLTTTNKKFPLASGEYEANKLLPVLPYTPNAIYDHICQYRFA